MEVETGLCLLVFPTCFIHVQATKTFNMVSIRIKLTNPHHNRKGDGMDMVCVLLKYM